MTDLSNSRFLKTCRREPADATPIWLMRQAGRYMQEYRDLRQKYGILEIIKTPDLACEVTMQPINAFDLDAAIIFADILPPLEGMGLSLEFVKGEGPVIHNPIRSAADVDALTVRPPEETLAFTLEAIKLARKELDPLGIPLIGFSGAPFTLAAYAIEGGSSRNYRYAKSLMMGQPKVWERLMEKLAEMVGQYLKAQAAAGAHVLQLFDSWVGALSPADYKQYIMPYSQRAIAIAKESGVPLIHFGTGTNGTLELIRDAGGDVIGVDWSIDLGTAWERLGTKVAIQGNLDPVALFAPWDELKKRAQYVLDQARGRPGHIFNLGHGILPETPVDNVKRLAEFVHSYQIDSAIASQPKADTAWHDADPSMIRAFGYNAEEKILEVVFHATGVYRYFEVPFKVYEGLRDAKSKGSYMRTFVIDMFPYEKGRKRRR